MIVVLSFLCFCFSSLTKYPQSVELIYVLLEELKESFIHSNLLLTSTFFASMDFLSQSITSKKNNREANAVGFDFSAFSMQHDFINFMPVNYDKYHSINDTIRELHLLNLQQKIDNLVELGVPETKIVI